MNEGVFESLFLEITINNKRTYIGVIYRAPTDVRYNEVEAAHTTFIQTLRNVLQKPTRFGLQCIIMGNFNYDTLEFGNNYGNDYKDLLFEHSFYSLINRPTRITDNSATCIDHMWTKIYQNVYKKFYLM